jgi:ubiquinone/menaquinone biosynthesis C-methylase UbiE
MENKFWDQAWSSGRKKETEIIDLLMHKSAIDFSYGLLGDLRGKKLLELGCGSGKQTIDFFKMGAKVTATDISKESIKETKSLVKKSRALVRVEQADAENLHFKENSFDAVYIGCLLMHADIKRVLPEAFRVLRPGGRIVLKETLKEWLFAFPYRTFSPYRKTMPHYITLKNLRAFGARHKEFYLFSSAFACLFYLIKEKRAHEIFEQINKLDTWLLQKVPLLRKVSWVSVARLDK